MKFSFENAKNIIKKTAIGAGIISASIGNLKKQESKPNQVEKEINKTEFFIDSTQSSNENNLNKQKNEKQKLEKIKEIEKDLGISKENKNLTNEEKIRKIEEELETQNLIDRRNEIFGKDGAFSFFEDQNRPENNEAFNNMMRNKYIEYIKNPLYKELLKKEMYGDEVLNEECKKEVDKEYNERLKQAEMVIILSKSNISNNEGSFDKELNIIEVNEDENTFNHEFSHAVELRSDNHKIKDGGFSRILKSFKLKDSENFSLYEKMINIKKELKFKFKEYLQILQNDSNYNYDFNPDEIFEANTVSNIINTLESQYRKEFIVQNIELINNIQSAEIKYFKTVDEFRKYLMQNTEIKARLNSLRIIAKQKFNYELKNNFDINDYPLLKEDEQYKQLKQIDLSDEQINELMKYTANNSENTDNNGTYIHPEWNYGDHNSKA